MKTGDRRVMVDTEKLGLVPGTTNDSGKDGRIYVRLDTGSAANFPAERVHDGIAMEDKDQPVNRMETK